MAPIEGAAANPACSPQEAEAMTADTVQHASPSLTQLARWAVSDSLVMTRRNLLVWMRVPAYIVFTVVQPLSLIHI